MKQVEVVLALPGRCWRESVWVGVDAPANEVVHASGLDQVCVAETGAEPAAYGVFGRKIGGGEVVGNGQRLELYRPLTADPRERRRQRARRGAADQSGRPGRGGPR